MSLLVTTICLTVRAPSSKYYITRGVVVGAERALGIKISSISSKGLRSLSVIEYQTAESARMLLINKAYFNVISTSNV